MSGAVTLRYHRPPERTDVFVQDLLYADEHVIVTFMAATPMKRTMIVDDEVCLEDGAPVIWFTFPGLMHDVGRFHTRAGEFTGYYANMLEPVELVSLREWNATDLFLDVWIGKDGAPRLIDEDELDEAVAKQWITEDRARAARQEAARVIGLYEQGAWPPGIVDEWDLLRVTALESGHNCGT